MPKIPRTCDHVFVNGDCCGAVALRDSHFCYWHHAARARRNPAASTDAGQPSRMSLPVLEDANSLMVTLEQIIQGILDGRIDRHASGQLLYSLQLASMFLPGLENQEFRRYQTLHRIPVDGEELSLPPTGITSYDDEEDEESGEQSNEDEEVQVETEKNDQLVLQS